MNLVKHRLIEIYGKEPETMNELAECVMATIRSRRKNLIGFAWDIAWQDSLRITHSAPHGVKTIFFDYDKGTHPQYAGWRGRVWLCFDSKPVASGGSIMHGTLTHTGNGGIGWYDAPWSDTLIQQYKRSDFSAVSCFYSYEYQLFDDDWPLAGLEETRPITLALLSATDEYKTHRCLKIEHKFVWEAESATLESNIE